MKTNLTAYSVRLEKSIAWQCEFLQTAGLEELEPLFSLIHDFEKKLITLLQSADNPRIVEYTELLGAESKWNDLSKSFPSDKDKQTKALTLLWGLYYLNYQSRLFYEQAAIHANIDTERLFYSSISEIKKIISHKVNACLRVYLNEAWKEIGFSPVKLL